MTGSYAPAAAPCDACGTRIAPGGHRFAVRVTIATDFDGVLPEPPGGDADEPAEAIAAILTSAENLSESELMAGVHEELEFMLCPRCRARLRSELLSWCGAPHGESLH